MIGAAQLRTMARARRAFLPDQHRARRGRRRAGADRGAARGRHRRRRARRLRTRTAAAGEPAVGAGQRDPHPAHQRRERELQTRLRPRSSATTCGATSTASRCAISSTPIAATEGGSGMAGLELTGFEGKVAVVTGAGRMRSIGRCIAVELAKAGAHVVVTGSGRPPERYPDDEKEAGLARHPLRRRGDRGRRAARAAAGQRRQQPGGGADAARAGDRRVRARRLRDQQRGLRTRAGPHARRRDPDRRLAARDRREPQRHVLHVALLRPAPDRAGRGRRDRQHLLGSGEAAERERLGLRVEQGGHPRADGLHGGRDGASQHPREHDLPRHRRHLPHGRHPARPDLGRAHRGEYAAGARLGRLGHRQYDGSTCAASRATGSRARASTSMAARWCSTRLGCFRAAATGPGATSCRTGEDRARRGARPRTC